VVDAMVAHIQIILTKMKINSVFICFRYVFMSTTIGKMLAHLVRSSVADPDTGSRLAFECRKILNYLYSCIVKYC
jgi:hypothetical protein